MAERRMFAKTIIDSDAFLDMPTSSQLLYFHLSMRADDDGFVNNPKKIQRMVGCAEDDLKLLMVKKFIIQFESGVCVIKHWRIHNYIRGDRYNETNYKEEKSSLMLDENKSYTQSYGLPHDIPAVDHMSDKRETQVRLGKVRLGKDSIKEQDPIQLQIEESDFSDDLQDKLRDWVLYKSEKRDSYKPTGFKSLLSQIRGKVDQYGEQAVMDLIDDSMANNWKGIIWDRIQTKGKCLPKRDILMDIISEGRNGQERDCTDYEADPISIQRLLPGRE